MSWDRLDPRGRRVTGPWLAFLIVLAAMVAIGVHRVAIEYEILHVGYDKATAARTNRTLREQHRRLEAEIAATNMPDRLGVLASKVHRMRYPRPSERIVVQPRRSAP